MSQLPSPVALPACLAWFRFLSEAGPHLGAFLPGAEGQAPRFLDLGPQDPAALLAQGLLRAADLRQRAAQGRPMDLPTRFCVPTPQPSKILCVAKNYDKHAREFGAVPPKEPIFFAKLQDTLCASGEPIVLPHWLESRVDHEAELGLVLGFADPEGKGRKHLERDGAMAVVAGYTIVNDVTARTLQAQDRDQKYPWLRSKSFDTFCPTGPFVVPCDALDASDLRITLEVGGEVRQDARTSEMVFAVPDLLVAMSRCTTLRPGDLIATGTPEGVSEIRAGDEIEVRIEGLGSQRNPVQREPRP